MALAQVVYTISTDTDFAARMRSDPESALKDRGFVLSKEELAFIWAALKKSFGAEQIIDLAVRKPEKSWV